MIKIWICTNSKWTIAEHKLCDSDISWILHSFSYEKKEEIKK